MKKDLTGCTPLQIEVGEWWYMGRIIQKQNHTCLPKYISFDDTDELLRNLESHNTFKDAKEYCRINSCIKPSRVPFDYGFGKSPYLKDILKNNN